MKRMWIAAIFLAANTWTGAAFADQAASIEGRWKGTWYIGMSSGIATMEIKADGSGSIAFSNLENFGELPSVLSKTSFDGNTFAFTASGTGGVAFSVRLRIESGGKQLRGNGKYGGFGARLELRRED